MEYRGDLISGLERTVEAAEGKCYCWGCINGKACTHPVVNLDADECEPDLERDRR